MTGGGWAPVLDEPEEDVIAILLEATPQQTTQDAYVVQGDCESSLLADRILAEGILVMPPPDADDPGPLSEEARRAIVCWIQQLGDESDDQNDSSGY